MKAAEKGVHSFALEKCSLDHQRDMALWIFPLRAEGLLASEYEAMLAEGVLDQEQISNFNAFIDEGLIIKSGEVYQLSIVGEVFMGHLVRNLKKKGDRLAVDNYIKEGYLLGELLAREKITFHNSINNRQMSGKVVRDLG